MSRRYAILGAAAAVLAVGVYLSAVSVRIARQSTIDEARPADVIVVLGAAEYNGRPSPVLRARLDHAYELWKRHLAPMVLTTGGAGGDLQFTEGEVGRDYLVKRGVPSEAIAVEQEASSTVASMLAVSEMMRRMGLKSAILVSDGYHVFRAKRILEGQGMTAYGSPRPSQARGVWGQRWLYLRQAAGFMLWRLGISI